VTVGDARGPKGFRLDFGYKTHIFDHTHHFPDEGSGGSGVPDIHMDFHPVVREMVIGIGAEDFHQSLGNLERKPGFLIDLSPDVG